MTISTDNSKVIENLQKENAELRECIKKISKAITRECMNDCDLYEECKASGHGCLADKLAKAALEKASGEEVEK